ncbi:MAG: HD-GYP domain-containing protein [Bdellovibrionales bacterium]
MDSMSNYFRIRLSTLRPEKVTTFNIYILIDQKFYLYLKEGAQLSDGKIENLHVKDNGGSFFVKVSDKETYRSWVKEEINSDLVAPHQKAKILRESSLAMMEDLFEVPDVNRALDEAKPIVTDFINFMEAHPESMHFMLSLSGHDFYTYNHSLDVSIYALGLGAVLGYDKNTLQELGIGSLFHDVGKRNVSLDILCKKGPLDEAEWAQMKMHAAYGLQILNNHPDISDAVKAAAFEHHESFEGNGYPQQLRGQEIHPFARIVALTDTYDAMTTQRSYNKPMSPLDALTMMKEKLAGRYDPEMLKAMFSVLFKMRAA